MTAARTARPRTVITTRAAVLGAALATTVATGLSGCGGGGSAAPDDGAPGPEETPLGAVDQLFMDAGADWDEAAANEEHYRAEQLIAECMTDQGFEYVAVRYPETGETPQPVEDELPWGTLEFAEQWGYGITTDPYGDADEAPATEGPGDPNAAIVEAMTDAERAAYEAALWGPPRDEVVDESWVPPSWEEMGCSGAAQHEVYGEEAMDAASGVATEDPFGELMDEMNRMWDDIATDERVLAAEAEWAACMADAGHPDMRKVGNGEDAILEQVQPIWDEAYQSMPDGATDEDYREVEAEVARRSVDITPHEIELAVADYTCREEVRYADVFNEVNLDLQQQFYDTHQAELEEWMDYRNSHRDG